MNGPAALTAARAAGARFRLDQSGHLQALGLDRIPATLAAAVRAQAAWIAETLTAETVEASPLPWRRHGPGWLAVIYTSTSNAVCTNAVCTSTSTMAAIDTSTMGDGTRLLIGRTGWRWWLTRRPPGDVPIVIVAAGTLADVLAAAERPEAPAIDVAS